MISFTEEYIEKRIEEIAEQANDHSEDWWPKATAVAVMAVRTALCDIELVTAARNDKWGIFEQGDKPTKEGRFLVLVRNKGYSHSIITGERINAVCEYVCGATYLNCEWLIDNACVFKHHSGEDAVIGWCDMPLSN